MIAIDCHSSTLMCLLSSVIRIIEIPSHVAVHPSSGEKFVSYFKIR